MPNIAETIRERILLPPGLPHPKPTVAAWQQPPHPTVADHQSEDLRETTDVVVIGSGITGCAVANTLLSDSAASDLTVTVLEARQTCSGATGRNGGHLISDAASLIPRIPPSLGAEEATKLAKFSEANILRLKQIIGGMSQDDQNAVELRSFVGSAVFEDSIMFAEAVDGIKHLQTVHPDSSITHNSVPAQEAIEKYHYNGPVAGGMEQHGAAALWPYRLITRIFAGLLDKHPSRFRLETNTPVLSIEHVHGTEHPYHVKTPRGEIQTKKVIHCTNGFAGHLLPNLVGAIHPIRGTMSAQQPGPSFPNLGDKTSWSFFSKPTFDRDTGIFSTGLYYAQQNVQSGKIFIGGERQRITEMLSSDDSVIASEAIDNLCAKPRRIFRDVSPVSDQTVWSGVMGFTSDGFPLIGKLAPQTTGRDGNGEWIAAGFNGHGMDKCWLSGEAVAQMVLGHDVPTTLPATFLLHSQRFAGLGVDHTVNGLLEMLMTQ